MTYNEALIEKVLNLVVNEVKAMGHTMEFSNYNYFIPIGVSAHHVHLSKQHLEELFGKGYKLKPFKNLSQPGQFAAEETITLIGPKGKIENVRILGPERLETQVEISASDARKLGITPMVRHSGNLEGTPGITIVGSLSSIKLDKGVIIADRHIHMSLEDAIHFGVKDKEIVKVRIRGPKGGIMDNVTIRVSPDFRLDMHIDTDDANAFLIKQSDLVELIK